MSRQSPSWNSNLQEPVNGNSLCSLEARYGEADPMGYIHHAVYASWFELGRIQWLRDHGFSYRELEAEGTLLPVASMQFNFHKPGRFEDSITVETFVVQLGKSRLVFGNRAWQTKNDAYELLAEGQIELACVNESGRPKRLPENLRNIAESALSGS